MVGQVCNSLLYVDRWVIVRNCPCCQCCLFSQHQGSLPKTPNDPVCPLVHRSGQILVRFAIADALAAVRAPVDADAVHDLFTARSVSPDAGHQCLAGISVGA